jgi:hypothetical protein
MSASSGVSDGSSQASSAFSGSSQGSSSCICNFYISFVYFDQFFGIDFGYFDVQNDSDCDLTVIAYNGPGILSYPPLPVVVPPHSTHQFSVNLDGIGQLQLETSPFFIVTEECGNSESYTFLNPGFSEGSSGGSSSGSFSASSSPPSSSSNTCGCSVFDIDYFLPPVSEPYPWDSTELLTLVVPTPDTPPTAGWVRRESCKRFVCIDVGADGELVCSGVYGGPTENNLDLLAILIFELGTDPLPPPGVHLYKFIFFGWYEIIPAVSPAHGYRFRMAQPSDSKYLIEELIF